ncbi:MAG TPA: ATP-dependent DNA helicase RecG [bacterium]|nr:ATP-dependent DNA helicase RecG [bacterium]HPJ71222.1 ATP-dependent DNA helicase RecG [bacterium]HPQ66096.1 ATP-dependent DNA helicase RecG [bacterium]
MPQQGKKDVSSRANSLLNGPVDGLDGIGPARARSLGRAGIRTPRDLLEYLPRAYLDRRWRTPIAELREGMEAVVEGRVGQLRSGPPRGRRRPVRIMLEDESGTLPCVWFNQPYLSGMLRTAETLVCAGKVGRYGRLQLVNPDICLPGALREEGILPVYPALDGVPPKILRRSVRAALELLEGDDDLPADLRRRWAVPPRPEAWKNLHFPSTWEALEAARRRLILEEFLLLQLALLGMRRERRRRERACRHDPGRWVEVEAFLEDCALVPTRAQNRAFGEIAADMAGEAPMSRLLMGDVGSGKTLIAAAALLFSVVCGAQGAVMAPTEVLARQLQSRIRSLFASRGVSVEYLGASLSTADRRRLELGLASGAVDVVVGTQALLSRTIDFRRLGLVVIDEQQRFGVRQKTTFASRTGSPHVLVMTATPIPRTVAYLVYGDLDLSVLDQLPPGRPGIKTWWIGPDKLGGAYAFIRTQVEAGRQAFVVYPRLDETGNGEAGARGNYEALRRGPFAGLRVGLIHGRLSGEEKEDVRRDFASGSLDVLVATTVVELGLDVPNASVMLVEGAERFGLAQLHQLRGRVGRGAHPGYCILQGNPRTPDARARLETVRDIDDGFIIARRDLEIRGPGEFFGIRQHGLPELRFGDILADYRLLETARNEARALLETDPELSLAEHRPLGRMLARRFPAAGAEEGI